MSVALLAHSGGPTSVINASMLGIYEVVREHAQVRKLLGARFGVDGILKSDFADLGSLTQSAMHAIARTPSSAIGSSRRELSSADIGRILEICAAHEIRWFLYTGGNGSMGTALEIHRAAAAAGSELQVVGVPKTIDNDLAVTDHSPGYASTARYFLHALRDIDAENRALPGQVQILEILGRNAGWLAAATVLARKSPTDAPHLVYCPERRLPLERFLADIERVYSERNRCVVAICEGQLDEGGAAYGAFERGGSRGKLAMNLGHTLAVHIMQKLKIRARSEKPGLLARSTERWHPADWEEARLCGKAAVHAAMHGQGGHMVTLVRSAVPPYSVVTSLAPLQDVAYVERVLPPEWISESGNDVEAEFIKYAEPLIGRVEPYPTLDS